MMRAIKPTEPAPVLSQQLAIRERLARIFAMERTLAERDAVMREAYRNLLRAKRSAHSLRRVRLDEKALSR